LVLVPINSKSFKCFKGFKDGQKKISLQRGPWGERGPKGLKIEAILARPGPLSPQGPLSKEIVLQMDSIWAQWNCEHMDSVQVLCISIVCQSVDQGVRRDFEYQRLKISKWAQTGSNLPKKKSWFHGFLFPNRLHQETLQQESLKWAQTDSNLQKKTVGSMVVFFLNRLHQETFAFGGPAYLTPPFTAGAFPMFMGGSEPPFTFTGTLGTPSFPTALAPGLAFALAYSSVGSV
jgi:hypothetical protein